MSNGRYWLGTIPRADWNPPESLPAGCCWLKGQAETGETSGYEHWQIIVGFSKNCRLAAVKRVFGATGHFELTRSSAADDYVHKEATAIEGTRFELGTKAMRRNVSQDWDKILSDAKAGKFDDIPSDVYIRCYSALRKISVDHLAPESIERQVHVYWGRTGTGKSKLAWERAGLDAYPKSPTTKWWDGYRGHSHVVIDEFRGDINIGHLLRWFDRYPVLVENKGGACVLKATQIWITSNLSPDAWFPTLDDETKLALRRRLNITHFA